MSYSLVSPPLCCRRNVGSSPSRPLSLLSHPIPSVVVGSEASPFRRDSVVLTPPGIEGVISGLLLSGNSRVWRVWECACAVWSFTAVIPSSRSAGLFPGWPASIITGQKLVPSHSPLSHSPICTVKYPLEPHSGSDWASLSKTCLWRTTISSVRRIECSSYYIPRTVLFKALAWHRKSALYILISDFSGAVAVYNICISLMSIFLLCCYIKITQTVMEKFSLWLMAMVRPDCKGRDHWCNEKWEVSKINQEWWNEKCESLGQTVLFRNQRSEISCLIVIATS